MASRISAAISSKVRARARGFCEYCGLPQSSQEATFHIGHVRPSSRGGASTFDNLALACVTCSLRKAARERVRDPKTKRLVAVFNPRKDLWTRHFRLDRSARLIGRTERGRATISVLAMNRPAVVQIRRVLLSLGRLSTT